MKNQTKSLSLTIAIALGISAFSASTASAQSFWDNFRVSFTSSPTAVQKAFPDIPRNLVYVDRYSDEMLMRYQSEFRYNQNCPKHKTFLQHMKSYNRKVDALNLAARGKCTKTFKQAACDVRQNLTCLQKSRSGLQISDRVVFLIRQSCPMTAYIHANSSSWTPYVPVAGCSSNSSSSYNNGYNRGGRGSGRGYETNRGYDNNSRANNNNSGYDSGRGSRGYQSANYGW